MRGGIACGDCGPVCEQSTDDFFVSFYDRMHERRQLFVVLFVAVYAVVQQDPDDVDIAFACSDV